MIKEAKDIPWDMVSRETSTRGVDRDLVGAIILVESSGRKNVCRYEPDFSYLFEPDKFAAHLGITVETEIVFQKISWGLMQIMGAVARELNFVGQMPDLTNPALNIKFGSIKLRSLMDRYGNLEDVIASYNAGSPRRVSGGSEYVNQKYVTKVLRLYNALRN